MEHTITIPGKPIGQPRQRHSVIGGHVRNYTPTDHPVTAFKYALRLAWQWPQIEGPVRCSIVAIYARPLSKIKKRGPNPETWHTSKPDADNIAKAILDSLNGVAWRDDSQVSELIVRKRVAAGGETARTIVTVSELSEEPTTC